MKRFWLLCVAASSLAACNKKSEEPPAAPSPPADMKPAAPQKPDAVKPADPAAPDPKVIQRGAYVAAAAGCPVCHTPIGPTGPEMDKVFAGGLELPDVAGAWRSPNITPDKSTGIGGWTDDQIIRAVREGVRPDGAGLYAIMPFMNYSVMTDDDAKALVAFLHTVKPVQNVVAPNKNLKMMQGPPPNLEQLVAMRPKSTDAANAPAVHGAYMTSLMLCSHCHWTPNKEMQPEGPDKLFSGGFPFTLPMLGTGTMYSANITSDPDTGIGKWTEDQIFSTVKTMVRPNGKQIQGPMTFLQGAWSSLDDKDLHAVAAYVKAIPPVKNKVAVSTFKPNAGPPPGAGAPPPAGAKK